MRLEKKTRNRTQYVRQYGKTRWFKATSRKGQDLINQPRDIADIVATLDNNIIREVEPLNIQDPRNEGGRMKEGLKEKLKEYFKVLLELNQNKILVLRRTNQNDIVLSNNLVAFIDTLYDALFQNYEYTPEDDNIELIISERPEEAPALQGVRDGVKNCMVQACIDFLTREKEKDKKISKNFNTYTRRLDEINTRIYELGADAQTVEDIGQALKRSVSVIDIKGNEWVTYKHTAGRESPILISVHNKHACLYEKEKHEINWKAPIEWMDSIPNELIINNPTAKLLTNKNDNIALITPEKIYKTKFDEYLDYPMSFSDAGVGKAKFLEAHPFMDGEQSQPNTGNHLTDIIWDADYSGFYMRTAETDAINNIKFDMKSAYKSFKQSPAYRGIQRG